MISVRLLLKLLLSFQEVCEAFIFFLNMIYIRFGTKTYRQVIGVPMGTNCTHLVADLYERDLMLFLSASILLLDFWMTY